MSIYHRLQAVTDELNDLANNPRNGTRMLTDLEMAAQCNKLYLEMTRIISDLFELHTTGKLPCREAMPRTPATTLDPAPDYDAMVDQTHLRVIP